MKRRYRVRTLRLCGVVSPRPEDHACSVVSLHHGVDDIRCHSVAWSRSMSDCRFEGRHREKKTEDQLIKHDIGSGPRIQ